MAHVYNPRSQKTETGGFQRLRIRSKIHNLQKEFQDSLSYRIRLYTYACPCTHAYTEFEELSPMRDLRNHDDLNQIPKER